MIVYVSGNLVPAPRGCRWRTARKPSCQIKGLYSTRQKRYCRRKGSLKDCVSYEYICVCFVCVGVCVSTRESGSRNVFVYVYICEFACVFVCIYQGVCVYVHVCVPRHKRRARGAPDPINDLCAPINDLCAPINDL